MSALTLADITTRPIITVTPYISVREVLETMRAEHTSALAISKKQKLLGIFTEQDVIQLAYKHRDTTTINVAEVMHPSPLTAPPDMDYLKAYPMFKKSGVHHLAVVDDNGRLVGIISDKDYLDYFGFEYAVYSTLVASVMAHNVLSLPEEATVANAVQLMARQHLSCAVVEHNGTPVGVLTASNLICLTCDNVDLATTPLGDVTVNPLHSIPRYTSLDEAIVLMKENHIQHIVVEAKGNIVGCLSREAILDVLYSFHTEYRRPNFSRPRKDSMLTHDPTLIPKAIRLGRSLSNGDKQRTKCNILDKTGPPQPRYEFVPKNHSAPCLEAIHCPLGYFELNCDVNGKQQTEQLRWKREHHYCELFDNIREVVTVYQAVGDGEDFIFIDHNHAVEFIGDNLWEELIGRSVREVLPNIEDTGLFEVFQRVWRTGKAEPYPATLYNDECLVLWVENYVFKLPSGELVAVADDITQHKQTEEALYKSETLFRTLARISPVGIFRTDIKGRCTYANGKSADIFGTELEACLLGQDWTKDLHSEDKTRVRQGWLQAIKTQQTFREEFSINHADGGTIWVICQATPEVHRNGNIQGYIGTITDITTLKITQVELERAHSELEQRVQERTAELQAANRELESFTYTVSHDLRAPLRAITGFSQALIEDFGKLMEGEARLYLDQLIESGNYMRDLIDGLLKLSHSTRGELVRERLDLTAMASSIIQQLQKEDPDRTLIIKIQPDMELIGDPRLIKVVMMNLLSNAWKYTAKTEHPRICVYMLTNGDEPIYCIEDNGTGFDMAYIDKLFTPFQRLHRQSEFPGIGVGLATVERIIHRHKGHVQGVGSLGKGAKICFTVGATQKLETSG